MNKRLDRLTAILIDAVVARQPAQSTFAAAGILATNEVPLNVALRVLTRPWERRHAPTPPPAACRA